MSDDTEESVDLSVENVVDEIPHEDAAIPIVVGRQSVRGSRGGRDLQVKLHETTDEQLSDAIHELKRAFDDDPAINDIEEAIFIAGLENLPRAADILEVWGVDSAPDYG